MCDYSLHGVASRPAKVGDKLTTHRFTSGTTGFAEVGNTGAGAVCVRPGTEIGFTEEIKIEKRTPYCAPVTIETIRFATAVFAQVDKESPHVHHDALEFPDGRRVALNDLREGQHAHVLQLPAEPKTAAEAEAQKHAEFVG